MPCAVPARRSSSAAPRWLARALRAPMSADDDRHRDPDASSPGAVLAAHGGGRGRRRAAGSLPRPGGVSPLAPDPGRDHPRGVRAAVPGRGHARRRCGVSRPARIARLIFPVGFYRTKARVIRAISRDLLGRFGGRVPDDIDALLTLKGVGRKTANLVVTVGFGKPGICVDMHVHRISNRLGFVRTDEPGADGAGAAREASPPLLDRLQRPPGGLRPERVPAAVASLLPLPGGRGVPPRRRRPAR